MRIRIVIVVALICMLCGCAYTEPNARFTVTALGFSQSGVSCKVYLQAIDADAKSEGVPKTFEVEGEGESLELAFRDIKTKLSKEPSFEHCQLILISSGFGRERVNEALQLCEELQISFRTRLVYAENIKDVLTSEKISSGADIVSLLKQNASAFGFGAHTSLFEIKTAIITNDGDFALPNLKTEGGNLKVDGLCKYIKSEPSELLDIEESILYAKENKIFKGNDK